MCPFRYQRRWKSFSFGVAPDFMDKVMAADDDAEREYNKKYPTCWRRFLHWLGLDSLLASASVAMLTGYLVIALLALGVIKSAEIVITGLSWLIPSAHAESFYSACLKPDGDWLHGVTRKECISRDIKGRWYTNSVLKKARKVM